MRVLLKKMFKIFMKNESGMTLMELVVGMTLMSVLLLTTLPFFKLSLDSYQYVHRSKYLLQSARITMNRMVAELRTVEFPEDVLEANNDYIRFYYPATAENIIYELESDEIERGAEGGTMYTLVDNVNDFDIDYFDDNESAISVPFYANGDLRRIRLQLNLNVDGKDVMYITQVAPRTW